MENINKIEILGRIGSVRVHDLGNTKVANMSVATSHAYMGKDNCPVIETTWHSVVIWGGDALNEFESLEKGRAVHIIGRIRNQRYTGTDGMERTVSEVVASNVRFIES